MDDTAILASSEDPVETSNNLQNQLNAVQTCIDTWRMKVNENKSTHVIFTKIRVQCPRVCINNHPIPTAHEAKCLGIHLDKRLTWKTHISMN